MTISTLNSKAAIEEIRDANYASRHLRLFVLRLDLLPGIQGNKYYKLKYNLRAFEDSGMKWLVTVGGAWSNHLLATSQAGKMNGLATVGLVRGDELDENSNPLLRACADHGMKLVFLSRELYGSRHDDDFLSKVGSSVNGFPAAGECYLLPEGGTNNLAVKGCMEILDGVDVPFDIVASACGTGGTLAGITASLDAHRKALGVSVVPQEENLEEKILAPNGGRKNFSLVSSRPPGRYGTFPTALVDFCKKFSARHNLPIEPVYTGRLFFTLEEMVKEEYFAGGTSLLAIHTGGANHSVKNFHRRLARRSQSEGGGAEAQS